MSELPSAPRETIITSDLPMELPSFTYDHGSDHDKALAFDLLRITREMRVLLGQFFLYTSMSRSPEFGAACNKSDAREGRGIILGSLLRSMVVSSAALFDEDRRTCNIPKLLRTALSPERSAFLTKFHNYCGTTEAAQASRQLLVEYGRRLRRGQLRDAIQALVDVRNTFVAHFDMQPERKGRKAIIQDIDHVIAAASIVVGEANVFILRRRINSKELRNILRKEALGFVRTVERGIA